MEYAALNRFFSLPLWGRVGEGAGGGSIGNGAAPIPTFPQRGKEFGA